MTPILAIKCLYEISFDLEDTSHNRLVCKGVNCISFRPESDLASTNTNPTTRPDIHIFI